jgi:hypothetical protein
VEHCPKVRLSQDRLPVEPLTQQQSWVRGERPFSLPPAKLGEGKKAFQFRKSRKAIPKKIPKKIRAFYVREKFVAPSKAP